MIGYQHNCAIGIRWQQNKDSEGWTDLDSTIFTQVSGVTEMQITANYLSQVGTYAIGYVAEVVGHPTVTSLNPSVFNVHITGGCAESLSVVS